MGGFVKELSDASINEFIGAAEQLVVVKFWDPWCSVCTEMAPVFEGLAERHHGRAIFAGLNMRENPRAAKDLEVYITPSFILFRGGKEIGRAGGLLSQEELEEEIRRHL